LFFGNKGSLVFLYKQSPARVQVLPFFQFNYYHMKKIFLFLLSVQSIIIAMAQQTFPLYDKTIPNSKPFANKEKSVIVEGGIQIISNVSLPSITLYLPKKEKANGTAVIICPGGGYSVLAASHEGSDVAKVFNEWGVTAFVLKYRIPNDSTMLQKETGPLQDAQRALQFARVNAKKWNIKISQIGIMGFSAGGHLASTAGTHFSKAVIPNKQNTSLRPDFMILVYPVISFKDTIGHIGSRDNLIGKNPAAEKIQYYSNELQVTGKTPPALLVHAKDDDVVKVQNSIGFYEALQKNKVPAEIHFYEKGGHGFGMNNPTSSDKWMDWLKIWMNKRGWIK
jgi:acetyl esterase/lipase